MTDRPRCCEFIDQIGELELGDCLSFEDDIYGAEFGGGCGEDEDVSAGLQIGFNYRLSVDEVRRLRDWLDAWLRYDAEGRTARHPWPDEKEVDTARPKPFGAKTPRPR